jgi:N4-gp56 family major capsid protein
VDYSNGVAARASLATTDKLDFADVIIQVAELEAANAMTIGGVYKCIMHPYTWATLLQDTTFVTLVTREDGVSALRTGLVGKLANVEFYISSNARVYTDGGSASADVYSMLFIAGESYGSWGLANLTPSYGSLDNVGGERGNSTGKNVKPLEIIMNNPGSAGSLDPLKQRGTIAWKCAHDDSILNSAWIRNLEHINDFS